MNTRGHLSNNDSFRLFNIPQFSLYRSIKKVFIVLLFIFYSLNTFAQRTFVNKIDTSMKTFPLNAKPGGTYTITAADASIASGWILYLPKNFTINVSPDVEHINWYFDTVVFEEGATIDLSRRIAFQKPPRAADGWSSPNYNKCGSINIENGGNGNNGTNGENGIRGANLTLETHFISKGGNLWVRTDGGNGGDGGDGGNGGNGGNGNCDGSHYHNAGHGGNGGNGGHGGDAGNVSIVNLLLLDPKTGRTVSLATGSCSNSCSPSVRPNAASGNTGVIVTWGSTGCPGSGGYSGIGGGAGNKCNCGWGRRDTQGNVNGSPNRKIQAPSGTIAPKCQ